ncbi:hypothetical protein POJ06DRAFT_280598 [Lipomyces tetrasporus]|uniref:Uncharacterized protein n=1 Tax=Lipomyces tetrasporus TaxID=54092 RepID=A0AAD7VTY6_9ASCO|nr:uncharacterized protein POJ06DRAFT_280598 [Lipomyces tetrasporus]KAJ8101963.1 hypothetical protein POJ06DRAFT_280598 [Lipomyces tetrasporus]
MIAIRSQLPMKYGRSRFWDIYSLFTNLARMQGRQPWGALQQQSTIKAQSSNTVPLTVSMDMSLGKIENVGSDYCNALQLLKNNPPEHWSKYKSESNTSEDLKHEEQQIATVVTIQRDIHEVAAAELREIISSSVKSYLSTRKPKAMYDIVDSGPATRWDLMEPDGSFKYWGPRGRNLRIAIEVGFGENRDALRRDKDMRIRGQHVHVVILVHLKESPKMQESMYEATRRSREKGICRPIQYRSHLWFGTLTEAFIEVWRADRSQSIIDFFTEDAWAAANIPDSYVLFDGYLYLQRLLTAMGLTAQMRFVDFFR